MKLYKAKIKGYDIPVIVADVEFTDWGMVKNIREAGDLIFHYFLKNKLHPPYFRGTKIENLITVLQNGIDNADGSKHFWGEFAGADKALEYGGAPKLLLCYKYDGVGRSSKEVSLNSTSKEEIEKLKSEYNSFITSTDNNKIWFSMFPDEEKRRATAYERAYGYYIKGDPTESLSHIFLIYDSSKMNHDIFRLIGEMGLELQQKEGL